MKKRIIIVLILLLTLVACSQTKVFPVEPEEDQVDIRLADMLGGQISLDIAPQNVLVMSRAGAEIIEELGARDRIGGILSNLDYKNSSGLNKYTKEEILKGFVEADLFICDVDELSARMIDDFYRITPNLLLLDIKEEGDIYRAVEIVGKALGKNLAARELNNHLVKQWEDLVLGSKYQGKIYLEKQGRALGRRKFLSQALGKLGFENINTEDADRQLSLEEIEELGPEIILIIGTKDPDENRDFGARRVYYFEDDEIYGIRFVDEMKRLIRAIK